MQWNIGIAALVGACIGSIPMVYGVGYLWGIADIRRVGRMGTEEENEARYNGVLALYGHAGLTPAFVLALLDALKGASAAWVGFMLTQQFTGAIVAIMFAQFFHATNPWMLYTSETGRRWLGGRGVPLVMGAFLVINPVPIGTFIAVWLTAYFVLHRHPVVGNVGGAIGTILLVFSAPEMFLTMFMRLPIEAITQFRVSVFLIMMHIIIRHLHPIRELMSQTRDEF